MTQKEMVIKHLKETNSITPMMALEEYGIYRLAAIINKLRNEGHNISTTLIPHINRFGEIHKYALYKLED
ncbi:MAG: helix-turn-helix domain-containing protein [Bacilli bacterium]|nr:helix-turn-helix domain-containing protein [Bacilli bacterium]